VGDRRCHCRGRAGFCVDEVLSRVSGFSPNLELVVQVAVTLILAAAFWWLVERPSTLLSQKIGHAASRLKPKSPAPEQPAMA
jgi:peptidoglycan/LPS O-acetylase OafA/YrhL